MNRNIVFFMMCCVLCVLVLLALNLESSEKTLVFVSDVKSEVVKDIEPFEITPISRKVDVYKLCEKICDRQMESCVNPAVSILVYNNFLPQYMTFKQNFKNFRPTVQVEVGNKTTLVEKWKHKRKFCPVQDLDPSFQTMSRKANCAIIGNSGILLRSKCGDEIDGHDFVLRANLATVNGYNDDVGNKTSVMMINMSLVRKLYNILTATSNKSATAKLKTLRYFQSLQGSIIWYPKSTGGDNAKKLQAISKALIKENVSLQFAFSLTSACQLSSRKWKTKKTPSTGLIALTVAQSFCKNITLYGFYPYERDSSGVPILHHYYEPNRTSFHTNVHNFDEEYQLLGRLHDKRILRRVTSPCKVSETAVQDHHSSSQNQHQTDGLVQLNKNQTETLIKNRSLVEKSSPDQNQERTGPRNRSAILKLLREQNQTNTTSRNRTE